MKPLTSYADYRAYLRDLVEDRRKNGLPCSNRWFAQRVGMQSTSWLTSLLQGRKGLSQASALRLSKALQHSALQARYFAALVEFNQAKGATERQEFFLRLQATSRLSDPQLLRETQFGYYAAWHHSAIRALIAMKPFHGGDGKVGDFATLGAALRPPLSAFEVQKSVKLLVDLGLVEKVADGSHAVTAPAVTTGRKASALQVDLFHQQTLRLAMEAMDRFPKADREHSSMTLGIAPALLPKVKDILAEARRRIGELAEASETARRVFQVNMQVFPLSAPYGEAEGSPV